MPNHDSVGLADQRRHLRGDCGRCAGLCCVVPTLARSADFAIDKPAGQPCPHLLTDFRCGIHDRLRQQGFAGCAVFDCFGAGQQVVQDTFAGQSWRQSPAIASAMFTAFTVVRQLRELLWYLIEAQTLVPVGDLWDALEEARTRTEHLTLASSDDLAALDVTGHRQQVGLLLAQVSEVVRGEFRPGVPDHCGADLIGADLRGVDLRGASLRGAYLIGADLRKADLRRADLIGADLRSADLRGANLDGCLFLTQPQLDAAKGDGATIVPASLCRPPQWPTADSPAPPSRPPGREHPQPA
jgi:hypothetical protein